MSISNVIFNNKICIIGFEVLTAVVMQSIIFWDMTLCSALSCTRRFGGTYRLHLQGRRIVQQTSKQAGTTQHTTQRHIPEDDTLLNAMLSAESQLTYQRNMSPPSSVSKNKPSMKPA
jgi:hypothetical protein